MTPSPYLAAYEAAMAELNQISARFEQLRMRKGHVENLIAALQPVFAPEDSPRIESTAQIVAEQAPGQTDAADPEVREGSDGYSYLDVPNPLPESDGDPFQRRGKTSFRFRGLAAQRAL